MSRLIALYAARLKLPFGLNLKIEVTGYARAMTAVFAIEKLEKTAEYDW